MYHNSIIYDINIIYEGNILRSITTPCLIYVVPYLIYLSSFMFILSPENSFPPKGATRPQAELLFLRNSSLSLAASNF
jgi:hypothetical protein